MNDSPHQLGYRPNVAALIGDGMGRFLAGERADVPGAWQLPQGGIEPGEGESEALRRELREELGLTQLRILAISPRRYRYDFPSEISARDIARRYRGQEQRFFLVAQETPFLPDPAAGDGEFRAFCWMTPEELLAHSAPFKHEALAGALGDLARFRPL